ncbi:protein of unknown function (plasmid) [Cupriavidus taiwanensis]|uniref:Uncharacterized protein n=1 Tax=Cupriavidus taiwanensis TaxID=164546 RepID=A0A375IPD6_9BURK|nr:hypothetical protein [Cupriavidus taiwanensis]SPK75930.1 protein of unknown function [Cupriavidus taiwanensis]
MAIDLCALVDFRSVVRAKFRGDKLSTYRYLLTDFSNGVIVFFDCEYLGVDMERMFIVVPISIVAEMDDDEIQEVRDTYTPPPSPSYKKSPKTALADDAEPKRDMVQKWWDGRWNAIRGIVAQDSADVEVLGDHPVTDLFVHPEWRADVIELLADKSKIPSITLRRHLGTFVRYGGTREALLPQMPGRCGAAGRSKCEFAGARKFGRKTTKQRRGRAAWHAKNGVGPFWLTRITQGIDQIIERDKEGAWATLSDNEAFISFFLENCCFHEDAKTGELSVIAEDRIPSERSLLYQRDRLLDSRPELQPTLKTLSGLYGGYATDLTYGVLDVGDIDAATFEDYSLAVARDETKPISEDNYIQIGTPTVFFGFCRRSAAAVGCEIDCNPEYGDPYRYTMYDMMLDMEDKVKKLRDLGLDPEKLPGIVSGGFDVIVADRGPAAASKIMQWTVGQKIDIRLTRSGAPMDKGTGEGGIGQIKKWLIKQRRVMKKLIVRTALRKIKALPKTFHNSQYIIDNHNKRREARRRKVIVLPKLVFVRIIIEAMNEINLRRKKDPRCLTQDMLFSPNPPEPTSAGIFRYYQSLRRGTANYPRRETDLRTSLLLLEPCVVIGGKIHIGPCWYGSPSSVEVGREGAERLVAYVAQKTLGSRGSSDITVLATRIPGKNLVWCLLEDTKEWLLLAPDTKSAEAYGTTRDLSETKAVQEDWCIQSEDARKKKVAARTKAALSKRVVAAAQGMLQAQQQDVSWTEVRNVDGPAQKRARSEAKEERFQIAASAHGLPTLNEESPGSEASSCTATTQPPKSVPRTRNKVLSIREMLEQSANDQREGEPEQP